MKNQASRQTVTFEQTQLLEHADPQRPSRVAHRERSAHKARDLQRVKKLQSETKVSA